MLSRASRGFTVALLCDTGPQPLSTSSAPIPPPQKKQLAAPGLLRCGDSFLRLRYFFFSGIGIDGTAEVAISATAFHDPSASLR